MYRGNRAPIGLTNKTVILVDDGLATGSTMRAAVMAVRQQQPARVIVAVPVGAPSTCADSRREADEVVCVRTPDPFVAVGLWYRDFTPTSDDDVRSTPGNRRVTWPSSNLYRHLIASARAAARAVQCRVPRGTGALLERLGSPSVIADR